jgi:DNA-binding GntR family transcriptional regulator
MPDPADLLAPHSLRLRRSTTADQAADRVRELILGRELTGGQPLRETELATALGVSRNTMREALRVLAREGLVVQDRHRVATVAAVTPEDVADCFAVRLMLERGAVDLIAARDEKPDLSRLRRSVEELDRVRDRDERAATEADHDFHAAVIALAGSPRLTTAWEQLEPEIRRYLAITTRSHRDAELHDQHAVLLEHLERGRHATFKTALGAYLQEAEASIVAVLQAESDEGAAA